MRARFLGDTRVARQYAWLFTGFALMSLIFAGIVALSWHRAQVYGWTENLRSPHAGDPFPWAWVMLGVGASGFFLAMAVGRWRRYWQLRADDRARGRS